MKKGMKEKFRNLVKIQCSNGNWNYDPYMHGMANGMILALAMMDGTEPKYKTAPKKWLRDKRISAKTTPFIAPIFPYENE